MTSCKIACLRILDFFIILSKESYYKEKKEKKSFPD